VALAILFGLVGLYTGLFYQRNPELVFRETANTAVFNVNEPVETLEIRYQGADLRQAKKALTIVQFTVRNVGKEPILKPYFDEHDLPGVSVHNDLADIPGPNGKRLRLAKPEIVRAEVTGASSQYLKSNVHLTAVGSSVRFDPIILDAGKSFSVRLLLSHSIYALPVLRPVGMVAGVGAIRYDDTEVSGVNGIRGVLVAVFGEGAPAVQLLRFALSGALVLLLNLIIETLLVKSVLRWRARRKERRKFVVLESRHPEHIDDLRPFAEEFFKTPSLAETLAGWTYALANNPASWQDAPKSEDTWVAIFWRVLLVEDGPPSQERIAALGSALLAYLETPPATGEAKEVARQLRAALQRLPVATEGTKKLPQPEGH